ncbi:MAG TPA: hypothetical protein VFF93_04090 [Luteimonas sp.]|nr:hypothetical protein [Luteimonas sp.]
MKWSEHADSTLNLLLENMVAEGLLAQRSGIDATPAQIVAGSMQMLADVIRSSMPLARIMDTSDLVLRASGPGVKEDSLRLSAVNWLTSAVQQSIRKLSSNLFTLADRDKKGFARSVELQLTGFAPGSLYAGIAVVAPSTGLFQPDDEPVFLSIRDTVRKLPAVTQCIDDHMAEAVREVISDPAQRDAAYEALYRLAPARGKDITSISLKSPGVKSAHLGRHERQILRETIRKPLMANRRVGSFVGLLREVDLDFKRFHLRGVRGIGGLRCVIGDLEPSMAKRLLGEYVKVEGEYEQDSSGRPRLMLVNSASVLPRAEQMKLGLP